MGHTASLACLQDAFKPLNRLSFWFKRTPTGITLVKAGKDMTDMSVMTAGLSGRTLREHFDSPESVDGLIASSPKFTEIFFA